MFSKNGKRFGDLHSFAEILRKSSGNSETELKNNFILLLVNYSLLNSFCFFARSFNFFTIHALVVLLGRRGFGPRGLGLRELRRRRRGLLRRGLRR